MAKLQGAFTALITPMKDDGEVEHETYHVALDSGITVIAGGHYATETVGVSLMKEKVAAELGIETVFIDVPTGL
jgi:putative NIF3 family GTP cyclohydrolase 1 type 2